MIVIGTTVILEGEVENIHHQEFVFPLDVV